MTDQDSSTPPITASDLVDPSLQLHWAAQLIASAGQTFAQARDDDSHRALEWDRDRKAFVGATFAGGYPFRLGLRPSDLTLLLLDRTDEPLGTLALTGATLDEGYEWLTLGMATYMGGAPPIIERPEYDMPPHEVGQGARFSTTIGAALEALEGLYGGAHELLSELFEQDPDAAPIRCWPHHFDLATLLTVETDADGAPTETIGVGLAPMGGGYESWYWYVTPWPYPTEEALPSLVGSGSWHTDGWTGAVLTGVTLDSVAPDARQAVVRTFVEEAVRAARVALSS
jgi:hypothetical protein